MLRRSFVQKYCSENEIETTLSKCAKINPILHVWKRSDIECFIEALFNKIARKTSCLIETAFQKCGKANPIFNFQNRRTLNHYFVQAFRKIALTTSCLIVTALSRCRKILLCPCRIVAQKSGEIDAKIGRTHAHTHRHGFLHFVALFWAACRPEK